MSKKKKKRKNKKADISLWLSIVAILISFFSLPVINKHLDKADIDIVDLGFTKTNDSIIEKGYLLINNGSNTAKNIELHLRILKKDWIFFVQKSFVLKRGDTNRGVAKNLVYEMDEFAPGDQIRFVIYSPYSNYLKTNKIDTLIVNKPIQHPQPYYGPYIVKLKHSDGIERPKYKRHIELKEINY